jgi:hypothetical protein
MQSCEEDDPSEPVDANLNLEAGDPIISLEEKVTPEGVCWLCNPDGAAIDHGRKPLCKQARPMVIRVQTVSISISSMGVDSCSMIGIISSKNRFLVKRYTPLKDQPGIAASVG